MIKENDTVWFFDNYDNLHTGTVSKLFDYDDIPYARVALSQHGEHAGFGAWNVKAADCHPDKGSCLEARERKKEARISLILAQLKTKDDLIAYMYTHTVNLAEEYTDWDAREAVKRKAAEFGITLK
mgnify:CR=1 FL=1